ncbi:MAG: transcription-repair coupling factor [Deltaproteobacteria bacterium]|jgi:transcription-repair coupling factor (superfamily II helicase)|nr:transcription-repair coupling factor [Deltaproteobacteria bacterium]
MTFYTGQLEEFAPFQGQMSLDGLPIPALARQLSLLLKEGILRDKKILVITPTPLEAEDFRGDLRFFWADGVVTLLPGLDRHPFLGKLTGISSLGERLLALRKLMDPGPVVVVTSIQAISRKLPSALEIFYRSVFIEKDEELDFTYFRHFLAEAGYQPVTQVEGPGEFSVRGGILDIFPVGEPRPVRLEFYGDFVESIRSFRVEDQKSITNLMGVSITPLSPITIREDKALSATESLRKLAQKYSWLNLLWEPISHNFLEGKPFADFENWTPLFENNLVPFKTIVKETGIIPVLYEPGRLKESGEAFYLGIKNHFDRLESTERPHLPISDLYEEPELLLKDLQTQELLIEAREFPNVQNSPSEHFSKRLNFSTQDTGDLLLDKSLVGKAGSYLAPLVGKIRHLLGQGFQVNLVMRSKEQSRRLMELLMEYDLTAPKTSPFLPLEKDRESFVKRKKIPSKGGTLNFLLGELSRGFVAPYNKEAFISEEEIFRTRLPRRRLALEEIKGVSLGSLMDISPGDYIVHNDFGIGQYRGLENKVMSNGYKGDFLAIAYRGGDMLYVSAENFGSISKYVGPSDTPPALDSFGSPNWERLKAKVKEDIRAMAEELLKLYAKRKMAPGHSYSPRDGDYLNFEATFPYEETPDQHNAIEDVLDDLRAPHPMDRLVCGDVGFGKTEVAIRAAYKVVSDGKQVAVLVPTTILAEQHERSFQERFANEAVTMQSLSRFKKPSEQKKILEKLKNGSLDIVIGTHRLLQKDVAFKDLGLLVIDEEHRFGVAHKEKLKKIKENVDVLSLSATPIPRSLSMSMAGIRDLSLIQTPPVSRLGVITSLVRADDQIIVEAIDRELARGGQVFFIHNRVVDIYNWVNHLQKLLPLARFGVGHGQMRPAELEENVLKFWHNEIDVWVTTTIVESGLDFPRANTILIDRADTFGLAQLYQLRGRVGRAFTQAYAYLMVDDPDTLTQNARKRLRAILDNTELGSGYQVALHDLQIRGSGNILGIAQHGQASLVGYEMYSQLVERTIAELKNEPIEEDYEPTILLGESAYLPDTYAPDTNSRIILYRKLSRAKTSADILTITQELADRFGPPPQEAQNLLSLGLIKILLKKIRVQKLQNSPQTLVLHFFEDSLRTTPQLLQKILDLIKKSKYSLTLSPEGVLTMPWKKWGGPSFSLPVLIDFLKSLGE